MPTHWKIQARQGGRLRRVIFAKKTIVKMAISYGPKIYPDLWCVAIRTDGGMINGITMSQLIVRTRLI